MPAIYFTADLHFGHKNIIANPNCTTAISLMALCPLHKAFGLKRFFASTYQAVSGTGVAAMQELSDQIGMIAKGEDANIQPKVYPYQIAYNVIPHVDVFLDNGYTKEEMKMQDNGPAQPAERHHLRARPRHARPQRLHQRGI